LRNIVADVGQDDGCVRVWDMRQPGSSPTQTFSDQGDYTTDMAFNAAKQSLIATSGDGSLAVYDVRKAGRLKALSESDEDERLSVTLAKGGNKVVSGTQAGVLELWSWGHFADCSDRCARSAPAAFALHRHRCRVS
jgi:WD40 repeat protein